MIKPIILSAIAALALVALGVAVGCGGGGGSGGGSTGPTIVLTQVEAVFTAAPTLYADPGNIMISDQVTFQLVAYDTNFTRTVLTPGTWTTNDPGMSTGLLDGATGNLIGIASTGISYTVATNFGGHLYSVPYLVTPVQARVVGQILDERTALGVPFVTVQFFNAGALVGSVTSAADGTFRASVPTTATGFNLSAPSIDTKKYYRAYLYGTLWYAPTISTCRAALPGGLVNGAVTTLPHFIVLPPISQAPPPPPTGCV